MVDFKTTFGTDRQRGTAAEQSGKVAAIRSLLDESPAQAVEDVGAAAIEPRFEGDTSRLEADACWALQHLVASAFVSGENRKIWAAVVRYEEILRSRLAELGLLLVLDVDREYAFTRQGDDPSKHSRAILRTTGLGLADTLVLLYCFERYLTSPGDPVVSTDEIHDHAAVFRPRQETDEAGFHQKITTAIGVLRKQGLLRRISESDQYRVHGVVAALLDTDQLDELLERYRALAEGADAGADSGVENQEDRGDE
jgi:hypothetical protein